MAALRPVIIQVAYTENLSSKRGDSAVSSWDVFAGIVNKSAHR